jgi:hypothetical protein
MLILLAGASLIFASACSGDDDPVDSASSYDDFEDEFMAQCTPAAAGAPAPEDACQCAFDNIRENVPLEDFQAFNDQVTEDPSAELPAEITTAITDCLTSSLTTP